MNGDNTGTKAPHICSPDTGGRFCWICGRDLQPRRAEPEHMSETCRSCGKPEQHHTWISEEDLNEWKPEKGFKKNSCARKPVQGSPEPELVFKVYIKPLAKPMPGLDPDR
jgi:hypothetical protein